MITERVGPDKTGPSLTKRISVVSSRILLSSFHSFDFVGWRSLESKVERTCKRRGAQRGCLKRPASFAHRSKGARFPALAHAVLHTLVWTASARQITKGTQKERRKIVLFPVTVLAINPWLIEPNAYSSLLTRTGL